MAYSWLIAIVIRIKINLSVLIPFMVAVQEKNESFFTLVLFPSSLIDKSRYCMTMAGTFHMYHFKKNFITLNAIKLFGLCNYKSVMHSVTPRLTFQ